MTQDDLDKFHWTSTDAAELKSFLKTETGLRLLHAIALEEPELLRKGDTNEILIRSGEVAQHKHVASFILTLTGETFEHHEDSSVNNYPSLTDDAAWDGPKLNENPE